MSAKHRLNKQLAAATSERVAGQYSKAEQILEALRRDTDIDVLGQHTALGLPRRLHSALLKLAKAQKDSITSIGYQYHLVPPSDLLNACSAFSTSERKLIAQANRHSVPRKIHQIWVGTTSVPVGCQAWEKHALAQGYDYKLWRDNDLQTLGLSDNPVYCDMLAKGDLPGAVDVARYLILEQHGGVYLDCDWYPVRNDISFHDLLPMTGLTAMAEDTPRNTGKGGLLLANSLIAAPAEHPVFTRINATLEQVMHLLPQAPAWWSTGPLIFTLMARGGSITLADADFVAGALPQNTTLTDVQAWCKNAQVQDSGLLLAWKSWVWR